MQSETKVVILSTQSNSIGKRMREKKTNLRKNLSTQEKAAITRDLFERYRRGATSQTENEVIESLEKVFIPEKDFEITPELLDEMDVKTKDFIFRKTGIDPDRAKRGRSLSHFIAAAACIALLMIGVFLFYGPRHLPADFSDLPPYRQYISSGEIENVTLPDGSQVVLNTGTTLTLRKGGINKNSRRVWLEQGEAFFDVKPDRERPFIVHLRNGLTVHVLGTSFTIQNYEELPFQEICVLNGKVNVLTAGKKRVKLMADQQVICYDDGEELSVQSVNGTQKALWRSGTVVLEKASEQELCLRIRQLYGKQVIFERRPEKISINITLDRDTSPQEITAEIAALYALSYRITSDQIIFY